MMTLISVFVHLVRGHKDSSPLISGHCCSFPHSSLHSATPGHQEQVERAHLSMPTLTVYNFDLDVSPAWRHTEWFPTISQSDAAAARTAGISVHGHFDFLGQARLGFTLENTIVVSPVMPSGSHGDSCCTHRFPCNAQRTPMRRTMPTAHPAVVPMKSVEAVQIFPTATRVCSFNCTATWIHLIQDSSFAVRVRITVYRSNAAIHCVK